MADIRHGRQRLVARILEGEGAAPGALRRAAFDNAVLAEPLRGLIGNVAKHANRITDEDISAARASGLSEDQIFELVVCAAVGQSTRQYDGAIAALDQATGGA